MERRALGDSTRENRLSFGLLDNALDYLLSAAEHARSNSARSWKYGLLHLVAAIELLLKARLEKEHWSLLFADVDKAEISALQSGDIRTVDLQTAWNRLNKIAEINADDIQFTQVKQLYKLRNQVQHFSVDVEMAQVRSLVYQGKNFFLDFLRFELSDEMAAHSDVLALIHEELSEIEEFVQARLRAVGQELTSAVALVDCPRCSQAAVLLGTGNDPRCAFCGFSLPAQELSEYVGEGSVEDPCLSCGERTMSFVLANNEFGFDHCISCGQEQTRCLRCNRRSLGVNEKCPLCGLGTWN